MNDAMRLYVLGIEVRISSDSECADSLEQLKGAWAGCREPTMPTYRQVEIHLHATPGGAAVLVDGKLQDVTMRRDHGQWLIEQYIYSALGEPGAPNHASFHAACVANDEFAWLLTGESNSGKSSLSLAALRAGYGYLSDDHVVTDGTWLWGLSRAVQFNRVARPDRLAPWLRSGLQQRPLSVLEGADFQPFFNPPASQWLHRLPTQRVSVVRVRRADETSVRHAGPVDALNWLIAASHAPPPLNLGGLLATGRAYYLEWRTPEEGLIALESAQRGS